jgi:hypothetical protein
MTVNAKIVEDGKDSLVNVKKEKGLIMGNWPSLLNIGKRTYDSNGRVCRPADKYNELRAIMIMKSAYPEYASMKYRSYQEPFAPIDGEWRKDEVIQSYCEIKSHAGKNMGKSTILNLRKWKSILSKIDGTGLPLIFIAQYEDSLGWANIQNIRSSVEALEPRIIHDGRSVQRSTSTELVWYIPKDLLTIVSPQDAKINEERLGILEKMETEVMNSVYEDTK